MGMKYCYWYFGHLVSFKMKINSNRLSIEVLFKAPFYHYFTIKYTYTHSDEKKIFILEQFFSCPVEAIFS